MKALSIRQPWASFIVEGTKRIENRSRMTHYRGPVLIHASLHFNNNDECYAMVDFLKKRNLLSMLDLPPIENFGGIIGTADLVDPWFTGPYGYVLENVKPIPFHPCKGRLGFFVPNPLPDLSKS